MQDSNPQPYATPANKFKKFCSYLFIALNFFQSDYFSPPVNVEFIRASTGK